MSRPLVDVVVPVHRRDRPLARAVASCRSRLGQGAVRITIVCHDLDEAGVRAASGVEPSDGLRFLEWRDGISSPAGPKNCGLDAVDADFTVMLDSDDYLEDGALDHWYRVLTSRAADVVVAPIRHQSGAVIRTPWARPGRRHDLDAVKDGLAYATAPRGMWRTEKARNAGFRYTEGLRTGEDIQAGLRLAFSGARIEFPARGPKYVLCDDAIDRTTTAVFALTTELAPLMALDRGWLASLSTEQRQSIATKCARVNLVGAMLRRGSAWSWDGEDRAALADLAHFLSALSPGYETALSAADRPLVDAARAAASDSVVLRAALTRRQFVPPWDWYWNGRWRGNLRRDSPLRQRFRAALDRR